jgi:pimeloyl-ACP methyl ester carboxylesterase
MASEPAMGEASSERGPIAREAMEHAVQALSVDGYRFHCMERGDGPPVLFVHGSVSDYRTWQAQIDEFAGRFRAIAYSRRYHWPNEPIKDGADYAMLEHVHDLEAIIAMLGIAPVHLVGHSYGAFLSLLLAVRRPAAVRSLVLTEPPVVTLFVSNAPRPTEILKLFATRPRTATAILKFGANGLGPATAAFRAGDMELGVQSFGTAVLGREAFRGLSDARMEQVRANLIKAEFLGSGFAPLDEEQIRRIANPTLLVTGEQSPALFHRLADRLQELVPRAKRVTIPRASHIVHEDSAPAFNTEALSFLHQP